MTTEVSKMLRKLALDSIFSETLLTTDFVNKNNINAEIDKYEKYAYIDKLDSYDSIKELIKSTPTENAKYNVSESQLKRIADSINDETYFEVVEQITKEVIEFRNKILGTEKDNINEDSDVEKSDLNNHADDEEQKTEIEEDTNNEEVIEPVTVEAGLNNCDIDSEEKSESEESSNTEEATESATVESEDSDTNKNQNEDTVTEKKSVFGNLKGGRNKTKKKAFKLFAGLRKDTESNDEETQQKEDSSQATVAYQPAVANNFNGNTGVTDQVVFSPASDFRTVEERISELYNQLVMETDYNKMIYIANQIIDLVPDKEHFMNTLLSKLKGM